MQRQVHSRSGQKRIWVHYHDKPISRILGTLQRTRAEKIIESLRQNGGISVEAVRATRTPMVGGGPEKSNHAGLFTTLINYEKIPVNEFDDLLKEFSGQLRR